MRTYVGVRVQVWLRGPNPLIHRRNGVTDLGSAMILVGIELTHTVLETDNGSGRQWVRGCGGSGFNLRTAPAAPERTRARAPR